MVGEADNPRRLIFTVAPVAKGRPRFNAIGRCYTPGKTRVFETQLRQEARMLWGNSPPLAGPLVVELYIYLEKPTSVKRLFPTVRGDIDNYSKAVLDAMNGILWNDDAQVVTLIAHKQYSRTPGIELAVSQMGS